MARKKKRGGFWEGLFVGMLLLVVLVFGISIADRWRPGAMERSTPRKVALDQDERRLGEARPAEDEPAGEAKDLGQIAVPATGRPTVEVMNGTDRNGLALEATRWLRRIGFDVVDYGNAGRIYERTVLIDRAGRGNAPERLLTHFQETYGVGLIERDVLEVPGADVRIILGQDFSEAWMHPRPPAGGTNGAESTGR